MRTIITRLATMAALALVVSGAAVAVAGPAQAATPCVASDHKNLDCDGQDPGVAVNGISCLSDEREIPRSAPDIATYRDLSTGWSYQVFLMYSPRCQSNWADLVANGAGASLATAYSTKVRRYDGVDGPYEMQHAQVALAFPGFTYSINSPMVWSPDNQAQACLSLQPFTGDNDQITCTGKH